jgi:hypothetical protein
MGDQGEQEDPMTIAAIRPDSVVMPSTPRVTPTVSTGRFKQALQRTVVSGAESAMTHLPGGPMMAVALRNGASSLGVSPSTTGLGAGGGAGMTVRSGALGTGLPAEAAEGAGTLAGSAVAGSPTGAQGVEGALAQSADSAMDMLRLQISVQEQNQSFTCMSNVLKAEHETIKNAISNIR